MSAANRKRGPKPKPANERRSVGMLIRWSPDELEALEARIDALAPSGMARAVWIRRSALGTL